MQPRNRSYDNDCGSCGGLSSRRSGAPKLQPRSCRLPGARVPTAPRSGAARAAAAMLTKLGYFRRRLATRPRAGARGAAPCSAQHKQDCTHWCAPGLSDAIAQVVLNLVDLYNGNRTDFVDAMYSRDTAIANPSAALFHARRYT